MSLWMRRRVWPLTIKIAVAAGVAFAFYTRYLRAPFAMETTMPNEIADAWEKTPSQTLLPATQKAAVQAAKTGRITARPGPVKETARRGLLRLGLGTVRDGLIYIPIGYEADHPAPLVLSLHGAGGNAPQGLGLLQEHADRNGFLVLAVDSRGSTWDVLTGGYGPDVEFINRALARTFSSYAIDPTRIAIAGFSDGASYALSLGITNGDLFGKVIAFSPGFMAPEAQRGQPPIFISHGKRDAVLPIEKCSRRIVPQLQRSGYAVQFREFDGPHTVPAEIKSEAINWWLAPGIDNKG